MGTLTGKLNVTVESTDERYTKDTATAKKVTLSVELVF